MMSRMLGALFGGTTLGGHHGVDSLAVSLITPPNFGSGGGSCLPLMVVVASGEPSLPVTWISPRKDGAIVITARPSTTRNKICLIDFIGASGLFVNSMIQLKSTNL